VTASLDATHERSEKATARAIGQELRRAREARGWSRLQLVARLPSGIGDRTLLSYEHGTRHLTMLRFIEICQALETDSATLHRKALQRARINLENLTLRVDVRFLLNDRSDTYRPMHQWARNCLNEHPNGIVDVAPETVHNLALFVGCTYLELVNYLARFLPEGADD
jgi:transcriptional regulator with XRE-family HTH domain